MDGTATINAKVDTLRTFSFVRGFAAHLLSFALGRELGPADSPALDRIADRAMAGEDSLRSIMKMVAMSEPFFHKSTNYEAARLGDHPTNH